MIHSPARASYPAAGQASAEVAMLSRMNGSLTRASSQRTATIKQGAMERMVRDMTPKHPASMDQKIHDWLTTNLGHVESLDRQARWRPGWDAVVNRDGERLSLYVRGPKGETTYFRSEEHQSELQSLKHN